MNVIAKEVNKKSAGVPCLTKINLDEFALKVLACNVHMTFVFFSWMLLLVSFEGL
jgi:hypothetical protein